MRQGSTQIRVVSEKKLTGYTEYLANVWTEMRDGKMRTVYIYQAPPEVARELLAKGARESDG